jgi:hypothetical protein
MRKDYYYIDADGNHCELSTGDPEDQAKIEAHIKKHGEYLAQPDIDKKLKIKRTKHVLVQGQMVEEDQDFVIVLEPFNLGEVNNDLG